MPQSSVSRPVLYLLYIVDLPVALGFTITTYADDIAAHVVHNNHLEASLRLQEYLYYILNHMAKIMENQS